MRPANLLQLDQNGKCKKTLDDHRVITTDKSFDFSLFNMACQLNYRSSFFGEESAFFVRDYNSIYTTLIPY